MMGFIILGLRGHIWVNLKEKSLATPGRPSRYLADHQEIFQAIQNRNPNRAREMMYTHIERIENDLFGHEEILIDNQPKTIEHRIGFRTSEADRLRDY